MAFYSCFDSAKLGVDIVISGKFGLDELRNGVNMIPI